MSGATVLADFPYTYDSASHAGIGVYRIHNAAAVAHTLTPSWTTAPPHYFMILTEISGISGLDSAAGTVALATGNSVTPTTQTLTPQFADDFLLAAAALDKVETFNGWTNGFIQLQGFFDEPTWSSAYLIQGTADAVNATLNVNTAVPWASLLLAYASAGNHGRSPVEIWSAKYNTGPDQPTGCTILLPRVVPIGAPGTNRSASLVAIFPISAGTSGRLTINDCESLGEASQANQIASFDISEITTNVPIPLNVPAFKGICFSSVPDGGQFALKAWGAFGQS